MTSEEAKVLLHRHKSGAVGADDLQMAEALAQTRRDPELMAWFIQQRARDEAISAKLQEVPVPADLARRIIAGRQTRARRRDRLVLVPMALAASLVLLITLGAVLWQSRLPAKELAGLRSDMAEFLVQFPKLDLATDQWPEIQRWLEQKSGGAHTEIPVALQRFPGLGCREVEWRGKRLMLVCFAVQGEIVHLFMVPESDLPDARLAATPSFAHQRGWSTASWAQSGMGFLAMTKGDQAFLARLLPGRHQG